MQLPDEFFTVHQGDARWVDRLLSTVSSGRAPLLDCIITSPPYGELKDYGRDDQIGFGQPYDEYLADCRRVFRGLHTHAKRSASMWVIADTQRRRAPGSSTYKMDALPFDLAREAEHAGWALRDVIIWRKDKTLPWSGRGRLRNAFEYVLQLVKTDDFKYRVDRLRDSDNLEEWWVKWPERYNPLGKVPENVWDIPIPVQGTWGDAAVQHACPLPPDLVERLILLTTDPGDVVLDPFAGTGTVVAEASRLGRRGLGIELNPEYVGKFETLMRPAIDERSSDDAIAASAERAEWLRDTLLALRALKYGRVLAAAATEAVGIRPMATLVLERGAGEPDGQFELKRVRTALVADVDGEGMHELGRAMKLATDRRPASKMGVGGPVAVIRPGEAMEFAGRKTLHEYRRGRTWMAEPKRRHLSGLLELAEASAAEPHAPVLSDLMVREEPRAIGSRA